MKDTGDRLKLHRRVVNLDGKHYTVIGLRPGTQVRFANNKQRILTDLHGARVLARLLWGLSFEKHANTLIVVDQSFLDTDPDGGQPSAPIVLVPEPLTHLRTDALRHLQRHLPFRTPPTGTVRWNTRGLSNGVREPIDANDRMIRREGHLLVLTGTPLLLKQWALRANQLGYGYRGTDSAGLSDPDCQADGSIVTYHDYHHQVSAARIARG
jgi:hypothetical protein